MFTHDTLSQWEEALDQDDVEELATGPYITFADFAQGVAVGAYGPDEDTRWVYIDHTGNLVEMPTHNAKGRMNMFPSTMICVAYYDK
jgi:hypothetical protein